MCVEKKMKERKEKQKNKQKKRVNIYLRHKRIH